MNLATQLRAAIDASRELGIAAKVEAYGTPADACKTLATVTTDGFDALTEVQDEHETWMQVTGIDESDSEDGGWTLQIVLHHEETGRDADSDDREWRRELAHEAGMLHGIDAYNDMMGY